jgi:hypothetical protein
MMKNFNVPLRTGRPLLSKRQAQDLQARWDTIQTSFIEQPCGAVQDADGLVASAIQQLEETFAAHRGQLGQQWSRDNRFSEDASVEDLRLTLQQYRLLFTRLISI